MKLYSVFGRDDLPRHWWHVFSHSNRGPIYRHRLELAREAFAEVGEVVLDLDEDAVRQALEGAPVRVGSA